jgi:hypothetical protein
MTDRQDHDGGELPEVGGFRVALATPRRLPRPDRLVGRVAVLDIAFASESGGRKKSFEHTTLPFIERLGDRLRAWVDHHDSAHHARYASDDRFHLATKAEHGACPEMITPAVVAAAGPVDTIVCHDDFDGLASAAKWIRGGSEPYPGCDDDARAVDTRTGKLGDLAVRFDQALRARPRDAALRLAVVELLVRGLEAPELWRLVDEAAAENTAREAESTRLARSYHRLSPEVVLCDVGASPAPYDRTLLLLLGQELAKIAVVVDGDTATFAAPYTSGVDFLERFGLAGGMPTLVSLGRAKLADALVKLDVDPGRAAAAARRSGQ